ncbi:serine/threonine-protein kinase [Tundrisphaera sp. TA3]|uniref:serine/threonine-protein kinase n=1 Tax=Tundrisphaera sp. TA3 TaxID=3435775 RepID=UPI003EB91135
MSAKDRDLTPDTSNETAVLPADGAGLDRPAGGPANAGNRYTFGSGSRPLEGYTIKRAVGRGGFGEVYYATSDSGKEVALKLITRNLEIERRGVVQCMNLKCPNLLAIHDIKTSDAGDTFVIMEYVSGPSLAHVIAQHPHGMPIGEVRAWLKGLVDGVAYLHDHGIVHRDLKPANLFMEEGVVKIGDYGLSKMISSQPASHHSESIGTCHYMAPEIASGKYHKPIDVYAIGVILYEMITGHVPFGGETVGEVLLKHLTTRPDLRALPEPYKSIVAQAMAKEPGQRPQRVVGLLPPDDAPRPRDVRFIGERKGGGAAAPPPAEPKPADDGIFRITDEEPVLYIGPDTVPPRGRSGLNPFARRQASRPVRPAQAPRRSPDRCARQVRLIATAPLAPPPPPEPPAPLPVGRGRVAELAGSMLGAAFWAALATALFGIVGEFDLGRRPQDVAFVYTTILLGSWAAMVPAKFAEGGTASQASRRLASAALGMALGVAGQVLAGWTLMGPSHGGPMVQLVDYFDSGPIALALPDLVRLAVFFAIAFGAIDWWSMTDRDRKARFRIGPMVRATALSLVPALVLLGPERSQIVVPIVVLTSAVVQMVSPWNEVAARYTAATRPGRLQGVA